MTPDEAPHVLLVLAQAYRCTLVKVSEKQVRLCYHSWFSENKELFTVIRIAAQRGFFFPYYKIPGGTSEKSSHALTGTDCQWLAFASTSPAQQVSQLPGVFGPT